MFLRACFKGSLPIDKPETSRAASCATSAAGSTLSLAQQALPKPDFMSNPASNGGQDQGSSLTCTRTSSIGAQEDAASFPGSHGTTPSRPGTPSRLAGTLREPNQADMRPSDASVVPAALRAAAGSGAAADHGCLLPKPVQPAAAPPAARVSPPTVAPSVTLSTAAGSSAPGSRSGTALNASRIKDMQAENVSECDATKIMEGLRLSQQELGRGSFGIVMSGSYRGLQCAVKVMVSSSLDRSAVRELLLGPSLSHPNVVQTYTSRCARLTHEFFDMLEGERRADRDNRQPRMLQPIPLISGDGFGDPAGMAEGADPYSVLHTLLYDFRAMTDQMMVVVVQEFCTKTTLANAIQRGIFQPSAQWGVRLARRALLRTAADVARGLLHLHDAGVVHGDVKPANVLLGSSKEDRRGFVAKVADFGLAHVLPHAATSMSTDSYGSPAYMAPEAFNGSVSRAADVWSYGVTLWEMLSGLRPYADQRAPDVVAAIQQGNMSLVWPEGQLMSTDIIALGRRCLSRDPADRPSCEAIVQELINIERRIRADLLAPRVAAQLAAEQAAHQQAQQEEEDRNADFITTGNVRGITVMK